MPEKRRDGQLVLLGAHDPHRVAQMQLRVRGRAVDLLVMQHARADELAADEIAHLTDGPAFERLIRDLHVEEDRRIVLALFLLLPVLVLFLQIDAEEQPQRDHRTDDAQHAERVGAGVGDGNVLSRVAEHVERFLRGAQIRRVRHCAEVHAKHLRQMDVLRKEHPEDDRHDDAQDNCQNRKQIERDA